MTRFAVLLALGVSLVGCASSPRGSEAPDAGAGTGSLAGTEWQLVEIQSMSDEVGTVTPDDPSLYTLSFGTEGDVVMQLNCNRGTGTWSANASSESSGNLRFGPLAVTRAFCPPPSLDERIARDLEYVRSYIVEGNRLYMSLMADGGIYTWELIRSASGSDR